MCLITICYTVNIRWNLRVVLSAQQSSISRAEGVSKGTNRIVKEPRNERVTGKNILTDDVRKSR